MLLCLSFFLFFVCLRFAPLTPGESVKSRIEVSENRRRGSASQTAVKSRSGNISTSLPLKGRSPLFLLETRRARESESRGSGHQTVKESRSGHIRAHRTRDAPSLPRRGCSPLYAHSTSTISVGPAGRTGGRRWNPAHTRPRLAIVFLHMQ